MNGELSSRTTGRIRIVHVIFRLDIGGLENGLVNVINGLPATEFEHTVVCLDSYTDFSQRICRDDVRLVALNKKPGLHPMMYVRLWKLLREMKPDIVHTRNLGTLPCVAVAAAARVPIRIHGEHGWDMMDLGGRERKYRMLRRMISPLVTAHVAVSGHIVDWLIDYVGISESKIIRIRNGVDTRRFSPAADDKEALESGEAAKPQSGSGVNNIVIGTVGRLEPVKDPRTLIEAIGVLGEQRPDLLSRITVKVVGDGSLGDELEDRARELGLDEIVHLVGRQDDVPGHLRSMHVFVLSSLNEGISNTILESMACGLPVVATAVGGNPEIVKDGQTGTLVPVSDPEAMATAIASYCDSARLRAEHGAAARERVLESLSLASMIKGYQQLYKRMVGR